MKQNIHTVNFHLLNSCNLRCKFCYAHFTSISQENLLSLQNLYQIIRIIKDAGCSKLNFAGGEPLLHPHIGELVKYAYEMGLKTSIVTNATLLKRKWLDEYGQYLDWLAISCDSGDNNTQYKLGRGKNHVTSTLKAFQLIKNFNNLNPQHKIRTKLNTVITRLNWQENMESLVKKSQAERWKILQILLIKGENDSHYHELSVTSEEFHYFVDKHRYLQNSGVVLAPESNDDITNSYIMINPLGQIFQNPDNTYVTSDEILKIGFNKALEQVGYSEEKFISRGGLYDF